MPGIRFVSAQPLRTVLGARDSKTDLESALKLPLMSSLVQAINFLAAFWKLKLISFVRTGELCVCVKLESGRLGAV